MLEKHAAVRMPTKATLAKRTMWKNLAQIGTVFYIVAFAWHIQVLPWLYSIGGRDLMATLSLYGDQPHLFQENLDLNDPNLSREFALMGSATHTIVFLFGMLSAILMSKIRSFYRQVNGDHIQPSTMSATILLMLWSATVFHSLAWYVLTLCFETKFGVVYKFARIFFNENGKSPFAWVSSVSYTSALLLGFLLSHDTHNENFQRIVLPSQTLRSWSLWVILPFLVWVVTLDTVTLPFYHELQYHSDTITPNETKIYESLLERIIRDEHSVVYLLGLLMCSLIPTIHTGVKVFGLFSAEGVPRGRLLPELLESFREVAHTFTLCTLLSWFMITLAMKYDHVEDLVSMAGSIVESMHSFLFNTPKLTGFIALYVVTLYVFLGSVPFVSDFVVSAKTYLSLLLIWNCHLVFFFGSFLPFNIWSALGSRGFIELGGPYSQFDALIDALAWVGFGSYIFPVVFKGTVKVFSVKLKSPWGFKQDCIMAAVCIIPLGVTLWWQWVNNYPALPVYIALTGIHLFYLMSWQGRPEYSGHRHWEEFIIRLQSTIALIEDYFSFEVILSTKQNIGSRQIRSISPLKDTEARIFGFHPHGMYPCSVIWAPLSHRFRKTFGKLKIYTMTDAFTHVVPAMREFCQYTGGLEVSRAVVSGMLKKKKSIMLVPGGQGEIMLHTRANLNNNIIELCGRHKGFVRMALRHDAELVPTFNFGELQAIENIYLPRIQGLGRIIFGFPLPFFPVGIWGFLPIPRKVKMTWVIGEPIKTKARITGKPTEEEVDRFHLQYFTALKDLIEKHKHEAGYGTYKTSFQGLDI